MLSGGEPMANVYLETVTGSVQKEETRSADEIKEHMKNKLNALMGMNQDDNII